MFSLDPNHLAKEEFMKPDMNGIYEIVMASRQYDLNLVMLLLKVGKVLPINDNGDSVIFNPKDKMDMFYIGILEKLLKDESLYFSEDQGNNIFPTFKCQL